ncbi:MAG: oxidoreductase [Acidimicrobiales bacterium]|nr:oxidoreductase [Acidimicrobiales bacterium]
MAILDLFRLDGDVAVVTGAGTGIGRGIALGLSEAGAAVVLAARREKMVEEVAAGIREAGGKALAVATDVTDAAQVEHLIAAAVEEFGKIDIWVNNAGGMQGEKNVLFRQHSPESVEKILGLNFMAVWQCTSLAQAAMSEGGRIINVSSIAANMPGTPFNGPYGAAKAAVNHMTKTFATELVRKKIRVNAIAPGGTDTEDLRETAGLYQDMDEIAKEVPLGRLGRDEDFGAAAVYLASRASDWVTGTVLTVSGGQN